MNEFQQRVHDNLKESLDGHDAEVLILRMLCATLANLVTEQTVEPERLIEMFSPPFLERLKDNDDQLTGANIREFPELF